MDWLNFISIVDWTCQRFLARGGMDTVKAGLPQIIYIGLTVKSLASVWFNRNKPEVKFEESTKKVAPLMGLTMGAAWIGLSYWGGCQGVWLLAFSTYVFTALSIGLHAIKSGKAKHHSPVMEIGLVMFENFLLYMGGFWTV